VRFGVSGSHPTAGVVAVGHSNVNDYMFLLYNHDTPPNATIPTATVCVVLPGFPMSAVSEVYMERVDDTHSNAKRTWQAQGSPTYPTKVQITEQLLSSLLVRENVELKPAKSSSGVSFTVDIPAQGIVAVTLSLK